MACMGLGAAGSGAEGQLQGLDGLMECSERAAGQRDAEGSWGCSAAWLCPRSVPRRGGLELEAPRVGIEG